ncbi:YcxB family protein [Streptomyces sp. NPDC050145]|uniref:YcxB family protein n=1 Tax=Streptomyces sp. NPDC050145 TaxID=3365602 RepID=UPI0037A9AD23
MEQHVDETAGERVELLEYQLTRDDVRQALGARAKVSKSERRMRVLFPVAAVMAALALGIALAKGETPDASMIGVGVALVAMLARPALMAQQFTKVLGRHGVSRAVVDADGVSVSNAGGSSQLKWDAMPRYVETGDTFVLLSADKNAACFTVLPKRSTTEPGGVEGLRALLDRHVRRV